jgi:hypothetical protein
MFAPSRGGVRGGADQFKWDDVRLMPYKERECYLGVSDQLGYLDKGGKWTSTDWWKGKGGLKKVRDFCGTYYFFHRKKQNRPSKTSCGPREKKRPSCGRN